MSQNNSSSVISVEVYGALAKDMFGVNRTSRGFAIGWALVLNEAEIMAGSAPDTGLTTKAVQNIAQACVFGQQYAAAKGEQVSAVSNHLTFLRDKGFIASTPTGYRVKLDTPSKGDMSKTFGEVIKALVAQSKPAAPAKPAQAKRAKTAKK